MVGWQAKPEPAGLRSEGVCTREGDRSEGVRVYALHPPETAGRLPSSPMPRLPEVHGCMVAWVEADQEVGFSIEDFTLSAD